MTAVTLDELVNDARSVVQRAIEGEGIVVVENGITLVEIAVPRRGLPATAAELLARYRGVRPLDAAALRRDIDAVFDQTL
jgi:antitoxin (DNA-binding transcriptional repressor) of toxin-antitoxin stability system